MKLLIQVNEWCSVVTIWMTLASFSTETWMKGKHDFIISLMLMTVLNYISTSYIKGMCLLWRSKHHWSLTNSFWQPLTLNGYSFITHWIFAFWIEFICRDSLKIKKHLPTIISLPVFKVSWETWDHGKGQRNLDVMYVYNLWNWLTLRVWLSKSLLMTMLYKYENACAIFQNENFVMKKNEG